jgi:hypothetical protein
LDELCVGRGGGEEVEGALVVEEGEVAEDVGFDFLGVGGGVDFLEVGDDLADGALAVAAFNDFEAGAHQAEGFFGHEQEAWVLLGVVEAAAGGELWLAFGVGPHASTLDRSLKLKVMSVESICCWNSEFMSVDSMWWLENFLG